MFNINITLFNFDEKSNKYYKTFLPNVELQSNFRTRFTNDSTLDDDVSLLIIKYLIKNSEKISFGTEKCFKTPKIWENLESKEEFFTFQEGKDFFVKGKLLEQIENLDFTVSENLNYEELKNSQDGVFFVHSVKDFEDELSHWEVLGY